MSQALIIVSGSVQGVCFRSNAQKQARKHSLTGYAKNLPDNSVEILVQGDENKIKAFIEWANSGPDAAHVIDCKTTWSSEETPTLADFETY